MLDGTAEGEWPCDFAFLSKVEVRARGLRSPRQMASALRASADRIPMRTLLRWWPHLLVLTIAGLYPILRSTRVELARRVSAFVNASELASVAVAELEQGHGPAYLREVLQSRPGDVWSRIRYPLPVVVGATDGVGVQAVADLEKHLRENRVVVGLGGGVSRWLAIAQVQGVLQGDVLGSSAAPSTREVRSMRLPGDHQLASHQDRCAAAALHHANRTRYQGTA